MDGDKTTSSTPLIAVENGEESLPAKGEAKEEQTIDSMSAIGVRWMQLMVAEMSFK